MKQFNNILVFGATSAICHALMREFSKQHCNIYMAARNEPRLQATAQDLEAHGASIVGIKSFDFNNHEEVQPCLDEAIKLMGNLDLVLIAHGTLLNNQLLEEDTANRINSINTNYTSCANIALSCVNQLEKQNNGTLAVISSVAGDRGRKSNYIYGASKSAINTLLQGLQARFTGTNIHIVNIKPGMIDTPMTEGFKKGLLWSTPHAIAPRIHKAICRGQESCYAPSYWKLIMWIIKSIPSSLISRLPI